MCAQLFQIEPMGVKTPKSLYFAYGSNMHPEQIQKRCAHPERVAVASLDGYRLGFYGHNPVWDGGFETIVAAPGERLWGVVYALTNSNWECLDQWQDARMDGTGSYFHSPAEVVDVEGNRYETLLYKYDVRGAVAPPSEGFLAYILEGARQQNLPESYLQSLAAIPANPSGYAVPRSSAFKPFLGDPCESCST